MDASKFTLKQATRDGLRERQVWYDGCMLGVVYHNGWEWESVCYTMDGDMDALTLECHQSAKQAIITVITDQSMQALLVGA